MIVEFGIALYLCGVGLIVRGLRRRRARAVDGVPVPGRDIPAGPKPAPPRQIVRPKPPPPLPPAAHVRRAALAGKAWVIDGDSIRVGGKEIRLAGLDAPEYDQKVVNYSREVLPFGQMVKSELIRKIGGKHVTVEFNGVCKYGRTLGTVYLNGVNINGWLVREGLAVAAYGDAYREHESDARRNFRGQFGYKVVQHPAAWRATASAWRTVRDA